MSDNPLTTQILKIEQDKDLIFVMPEGVEIKVNFGDFIWMLLHYTVDARRPVLGANVVPIRPKND